ncbi:hypothetical protein SAMN05444008_109108 [Cnuella takakiae]|uniref:Lipopolysaccharide biosynthesis protein n=1 Tax=Cnuella takakiae TaxID=1302690 RepID=A0A1M5CK32_9BACT|nr:hypothetical protein [Cnuella takakiae]OLY91856.1 hypothetical protein BUE76_08045 [Cnuella takakiae]SHF55083.1 hypothetical protein SAMN05444008_109108 [Cnuella takakiae]
MNKLRDKLNGKNILYIGVEFYHYSSEIKNKMEEYGGTVTFYPERDTSIIYGLVNRLFPNQIDQYQNFYYSKLIKRISGDRFDYFLVIRGFKMPVWFIEKVKQINPGIVCIMYQWDANINSPFLNLEPQYNIIPQFDKVLSFDLKDVEENPELLQYCPTFYTDEILALKDHDLSPTKYDFFFFGSYLPERYKGLMKMKSFTKQNGYSLQAHFYMPFRYYLIERLKGVNLDRKLLKHRKMNRSEYLEQFKQSKVIVDVSNAKQTGLAMRVLDAFGAGKKVITTNSWITREVGANNQQVHVIDLDNLSVPKDFMEEQTKFSPNINYTMDKWLMNIFS